jgi:hypothetical protein
VFGAVGPTLFFIGIAAMPLTSITLHMLTCGFIVSEMFDKPTYGTHWKVGTLLPAIGVLGVAVKLQGWLPVASSALTLVFLPIAYIGFLILFWRAVTRRDDAVSQRLAWLRWPMLGVILIISGLALQKALQTAVQLFGGA